MMEPKWTQGPWGVANDEAIKIKAHDGSLATVTHIHLRGRRSTSEVEANAHLISAAPDLYAALEAAMAFIESHVADPDITDVMIRNYNALQDLKPRAALAKARGEAL